MLPVGIHADWSSLGAVLELIYGPMLRLAWTFRSAAITRVGKHFYRVPVRKEVSQQGSLLSPDTRTYRLGNLLTVWCARNSGRLRRPWPLCLR